MLKKNMIFTLQYWVVIKTSDNMLILSSTEKIFPIDSYISK